MACYEWGSLSISQIMLSCKSTSFKQIKCIKDFDKLTREHREHRVFNHLLHMIPRLEERLTDTSTEEIVHIGELVSSVMYSRLV
jgi:hypothetical protein